MRYVFGFLCVCALTVMPLVGCSETTGDGGSGGDAGSGGMAGDGGGGGNGVACVDKVCPCTEAGIRAAIEAGGEDPYTFDCGGSQTVVTEAEIVINNDVILDGEGDLIVDAGSGGAGGASGDAFAAAEIAPKVNGAHRVFSIPEGVTAELIGFTVTGGATAGDGGGILNEGTLELAETTVSGNDAQLQGGGIANAVTGELTLTRSVVSGNTALLRGGGIENGGTATLSESLVIGNHSDERTCCVAGGGVFNRDVGTLTVTDSVVTQNTTAVHDGGGIGNEGAATVINSEFSENVAAGGGGIWSHDFSSLMVRGCMVVNNTAESSWGGGIGGFGTVSVIDTLVSGNTSMGVGGGIFNGGTGGQFTVTGCLVSGNAATGSGGGIFNEAALVVEDTTLSGNTSGWNGGGIGNGGRREASLLSSTIANNTARVGGGIANDGTLTTTNCTVSENDADIAAGGIGNDGTLTVTSTTVSGNTANQGSAIGNGLYLTMTNTIVEGDCYVMSLTSGGGNIESPGNTCGLDEAKGDQINVTEEQLNLGPLADNGGPTETHALLSGSPAINQIPVEYCVDADGAPLTEDQRGVSRPQGPTCDAGAFELEHATVTGSVTYAGSGAPAEGATVSVLGASVSAVTDAQGGFTSDVPVGSAFFQVSKEGTWGQIELETVPTTGDVRYELVEDSLVAEVEQFLMIEFSETQGVVDVIFTSPSGLGGETAQLSVPYDSSLTFDAAEQPVLSDQLVLGGGEDLVFVGVDLTQELIVSPMGVDGVNSCDLENPVTVYPVLAKSFTRVRQVRCTPLP